MSQMITSHNYNDIKSWIKVINANKKRTKIFYAESDDEFIADGKLFKMMPSEYAKYATFDEFYLHINVKNKEILFEAWNIADFDEMRRSEIESGFLDWDKMEFIVLTFLTTNITQLSFSASIVAKHSPVNGATSHTSHNPYSHQTRTPHTPYTHIPYKPTPTYSEVAYKEREAIREKFATLVKQNKTGLAIEHIESAIIKMCEEKKFAGLDLFISSLPIETMNVPALFSVLKASRGADHLLKERQIFFDKVRSRLVKSGKLTKMFSKLNNVAPGKEYAGVVKYTNEPTETKANAPN